MNSKDLISELASRAQLAAKTLRSSSIEERREAVLSIARTLLEKKSDVLAANKIDLDRERTAGMPESLLDRLSLTEQRILSIIESSKKVAALADPLGRVLKSRILNNGLETELKSVPFGVVGMIYEARPNVTIDATIILIMSGNAALLRGSSSARQSNSKLVEIIRLALSRTNISPEVVQLVPSEDRDTVKALLQARGEIDLVIPRGSASLIRTVVGEALVPTIETGAGVCHIYVDEFADISKAIPIVINSKTHRPSVCNAVETLLVNSKIAREFLPIAMGELLKNSVYLHCDEESFNIANENNISVRLATEESWSTEYGSLELNIKVVTDVNDAMKHINRYGTKHTEAIISEDQSIIDRFIKLSDCAAVMINTSTRFTDGEEMGFGAEIGISNQKLHARGPMGLEEMTTTTWIVRGNGQIRD